MMATDATGSGSYRNTDVVLELDHLWVALRHRGQGVSGPAPVIDRLNAASRNLRKCDHEWTADRLAGFARQLGRAPLEQQQALLKSVEDFVLYVLSAALEGRLLSGSGGVRSF